MKIVLAFMFILGCSGYGIKDEPQQEWIEVVEEEKICDEFCQEQKRLKELAERSYQMEGLEESITGDEEWMK